MKKHFLLAAALLLLTGCVSKGEERRIRADERSKTLTEVHNMLMKNIDARIETKEPIEMYAAAVLIGVGIDITNLRLKNLKDFR